MVGEEDPATLKQKAKQLAEKLRHVEGEIEAISSRLQAPGQPGLKDNLLDSEGFPRADIDIPRVRADRHRLAVLHSDHKALSKKIEEAIIAVHAAARASGRSGSGSASDQSCLSPGRTPAGVMEVGGSAESGVHTIVTADALPPAPPQHAGNIATPPTTSGHAPFALIDEVTPGSPGDIDGLRIGDYLLAFGGVTSHSPGSKVALVAAELQESEGRQVQVRVMRAGAEQALAVTPRQWEGRGLLGCHMQPL